MGTEEEYTEFYKSISKDYLDPLAYTHFNAEGEIEFKSILYLPKKAPFDMMDNYWSKKSEVKLFVRRVLVAEKFDELLPRYLNFVRGVLELMKKLAKEEESGEDEDEEKEEDEDAEK